MTLIWETIKYKQNSGGIIINSRFHLSTQNRKVILAVLSLVFVIAVGLWTYFSFAGTGTGVAYDWRTGKSPSFYRKVSSEPDGWDYVDFSSKLADGTNHQFGIWVPVAVPMIGKRSLQIGDSGDDVKALQTALNLIRPTDSTDQYYYDQINVSGTYDQATTDAVYTLQGYYNLPPDGIADFNFQSMLYEQVVTPGN